MVRFGSVFAIVAIFGEPCSPKASVVSWGCLHYACVPAETRLSTNWCTAGTVATAGSCAEVYIRYETTKRIKGFSHAAVQNILATFTLATCSFTVRSCSLLAC